MRYTIILHNSLSIIMCILGARLHVLFLFLFIYFSVLSDSFVNLHATYNGASYFLGSPSGPLAVRGLPLASRKNAYRDLLNTYK